MDFERMDMGGATFHIFGDDGIAETFVEPALTAAQLTRTDKEIATRLRLEDFTGADLRAHGLQGCNLRATYDAAAHRLELDGCGDFQLLLQYKDGEDAAVVHICGHGLRSCGLIRGKWDLELQPPVRFLTLVQSWPWENAHSAHVDAEMRNESHEEARASTAPPQPLLHAAAAKVVHVPQPPNSLVVGACYRVVRAFPKGCARISPDNHDIVKVLQVDPLFPDSAIVRIAYRVASEAVCEVPRYALEDDCMTEERIEAERDELCKMRDEIAKEITRAQKQLCAVHENLLLHEDSIVRWGRIRWYS